MEGVVGRRPALSLPGVCAHSLPRVTRSTWKAHNVSFRHRWDRIGIRPSQVGRRRPTHFIAGGASCARQAIEAGIVDEIDLQVTQ